MGSLENQKKSPDKNTTIAPLPKNKKACNDVRDKYSDDSCFTEEKDSYPQDHEEALQMLHGRSTLKDLPSTLQNNPSFLLKAIKEEAIFVEDLPPEAKKNPDIGLAVVERNGLDLQELDDKLQNTYDIVMVAVKDRGIALEFASPTLQNTYAVVRAAIQEYGSSIKHASKNLQKDWSLVLDSIRQPSSGVNDLRLQYADETLRTDPSFVLKCVQANGLELSCVPQMNNNLKIALAAVKNNLKALSFVDKALKKTSEFKENLIKIQADKLAETSS